MITFGNNIAATSILCFLFAFPATYTFCIIYLCCCGENFNLICCNYPFVLLTCHVFSFSSQNAAVTSEVGDYPDHPQPPTNVPENLSSSEVDGSSSAIEEYNESKQDTALPSGGHQYSGMHTSPDNSYGFVPPMLGTQLTPFDNSETQTRDISRLPSFVVSPVTYRCFLFVF